MNGVLTRYLLFLKTVGNCCTVEQLLSIFTVEELYVFFCEYVSSATTYLDFSHDVKKLIKNLK